MGISDVIKERRYILGLTLKEIGDKVGVTEATVQRWESGNIVNLRHKRIIKLADVLKVHPAALMGWDLDSHKDIVLTDDDITLLQAYHQSKNTNDPVLKALISAIDKHIKENVHKDG